MSRRAFTLLEVLIAIALTAALLSAMFGFLFNMLNARRQVLDLTARHRAAATLIERLEADLIACTAGDTAAGAGVRGDESSVLILSRGVAATLADRGAEDPNVFADLLVSEFRFNEESKRLEARRGVVNDSRSSRSEFYDLNASVFRVRFRYHDGAGWRSSFDSSLTGAMPAAVEVAVWFDPWPGEDWSDATEEQLIDDRLSGPERMTFDAEGAFDEVEYGELSDIESFDEPIPDRVRVIVIPDATAPDETTDSPDQSSFTKGGIG
jgi:prepilin-type N-terminal cleavage/methylation domain-containing protein